MDKYTTAELIDKEKGLPSEEQKEKFKTILSNDAYAISEFIEALVKKIEQARLSI